MKKKKTEIIKNDKSKLNNPAKKKTKKKNSVKRTLKIIGTVCLSLILVVIITGSILATAFTIYVMKFMDSSKDVNLENLQLSYTTFFYAKDKNGVYQPIETLTNGEKCIWVNIENVPQLVQEAFVNTEDERFYNHEGVDFKRTFSAFANYFLHFYKTEQGGSTITQQLVKNITGDDQVSSSRKIKEIFRAMNLEKSYTKTDILEAYLNIISFGGQIRGVQAAANYYFDKNVSELTIAEGACLAAIPQSPNKYNPIKNPDANKLRREYVLGKMYENGSISTDEYKAAMKEELKFVGSEKTSEDKTTDTGVTSYFIDATIKQVIADFSEKYGISSEEAEERLKSGGYKIYTTEDISIQDTLEKEYKDPTTFSAKAVKNPPQSSCIIMDYNGNVLGVVGGIGEKTESRCLNRATDTYRSPGSCIKPIASYGPAIMLDKINWSSTFVDQPLQVKDPKTGLFKTFETKNQDTGKMVPWPKNYSNSYSYKKVYTYDCLAQSLNTAAARIVEDITPEVSYNFLKDKLHFSKLQESDKDRAPMAVGALTKGVSLQELVASYQIFGNQGKYNKPTYYTKITDANDNVIIEHQYIPEQPMDPDSAYIMNRMMNKVVEYGTGVYAKNGLTVELAGKTGTAQDWNDLLFVGCTPDYVAGVWYGYDTPKDTRNTYYKPTMVWNKVFKTVVNNGNTKKFAVNPNVKAVKFCTETGQIANDTCPKSAIVGYYKESDLQNTCTINHNG